MEIDPKRQVKGDSMASDGQSVQIPAASLVHGSQAPITASNQVSGKNLQQSSKGVASTSSSGAAATAAAATATATAAATGTATATASADATATAAARAAAAKAATQAQQQAPQPKDLQAQVALLNKYLNDSGRPDQFRVDPAADGTSIQEINPASGAVVAQYSAAEFPELARSVGISGVIVNSHA